MTIKYALYILFIPPFYLFSELLLLPSWLFFTEYTSDWKEHILS